jgi:hypothetical protein
MSDQQSINSIITKLNSFGKATREKIKRYYESVKAISDPHNTKYHYQKSVFLKKNRRVLRLHEENESYQQIQKSFIENQLIRSQLNPRVTLTKHIDNSISSITIDISKLISAEVSAWKTGDFVSEEDIERPFSKTQQKEERFSKHQTKESPFIQKKSYEGEEYTSPFSRTKPPSSVSSEEQEYKFKGSESGFENMKRLRAIYQEETGRKPVLRGKRTKHYREWIKEQQKKERVHGKTPIPTQKSIKKPEYKSRSDVEGELKYCAKCGSELDPNSDYCGGCGWKIQLISLQLINLLTNIFNIELLPDEEIEKIHNILVEIHHIYSEYVINIDTEDQIEFYSLFSALSDTSELSEETQITKQIITIYSQYDDSILWTQTDLDRLNELDQELIELGQDPTWVGGVLYESDIYTPLVNYSGLLKESIWKKAEREGYVPKREREIREQKQVEQKYVKTLREQYTEETGKPPIVSGKKTKHYKNWLRKKKRQEQIEEYKEDEELREEQRQYREQKLIEQQKDQELSIKEKEQESKFKKESKEFKRKEKESKSLSKKQRSFSKKSSDINSLNIPQIYKAYGKKITVEIEGMITFFLNYDKYNIELNIYIDFKTPDVLIEQKGFIEHLLSISKNFTQKLKVLIQP